MDETVSHTYFVLARIIYFDTQQSPRQSARCRSLATHSSSQDSGSQSRGWPYHVDQVCEFVSQIRTHAFSRENDQLTAIAWAGMCDSPIYSFSDVFWSWLRTVFMSITRKLLLMWFMPSWNICGLTVPRKKVLISFGSFLPTYLGTFKRRGEKSHRIPGFPSTNCRNCQSFLPVVILRLVNGRSNLRRIGDWWVSLTPSILLYLDKFICRET